MQWLVTLVAIPAGSLVGALLLRLVGASWVWTAGIGVLWGGAGGLWLAIRVMRHVTFDEPLRYQRRLVKGEFSRRFSVAVDSQPFSLSLKPPDIGYLAPAVRRSMGWDVPSQQPLPERTSPVNPFLTNPYLTHPYVTNPYVTSRATTR